MSDAFWKMYTGLFEELARRARFYESVMKKQAPHQLGDRRCKVAVALDLSCCNPKCNGMWGSGCWCCHYLEFAADADDKLIQEHLELRRRFEEKEAKGKPRKPSPIEEVALLSEKIRTATKRGYTDTGEHFRELEEQLDAAIQRWRNEELS